MTSERLEVLAARLEDSEQASKQRFESNEFYLAFLRDMVRQVARELRIEARFLKRPPATPSNVLSNIPAGERHPAEYAGPGERDF